MTLEPGCQSWYMDASVPWIKWEGTREGTPGFPGTWLLSGCCWLQTWVEKHLQLSPVLPMKRAAHHWHRRVPSDSDSNALKGCLERDGEIHQSC